MGTDRPTTCLAQSFTCQVPVIQLQNVPEQVGGEEFQAINTIVLYKGKNRLVIHTHTHTLREISPP